MYATSRFHLLICMVLTAAVIPISLAFNIDTANASVYLGEQEDFFGYKVLQFMSHTNKGIIVTAPLRLNGSGGVFKRNTNNNESWFSPNGSSETQPYSAKHLGLSIAKDSKGSQFTVCSPSLAHPCHENIYLNSLCYKITDDFQQLSSFTPMFEECKNKQVDLVFLFDGSQSMTPKEFYQTKIFIKNIMESLKNSSFRFAAVQFASNYSTVFTFNDYVADTALEKLEKEEHMRQLTNTYKALNFTLYEILQSKTSGATKDASKVVVIITDGNPSDNDNNYQIIPTYNQKGIRRIVIGVKEIDWKKFEVIASKPESNNVFKIENYERLPGFLATFQNQVFGIEGSIDSQANKLINEMSQSGFSIISHKDTLILGSVGSNRWSGALNVYQTQDQKIYDVEIQEASYMGYSISVGERNGNFFYFTGAPRFNHTGQVVVFQDFGDRWEVVQRIPGWNQVVGSYFGAELCSVDIDSDGNTDFLLVGAPLFFIPEEKKEGKIYVYSLSDEMKLNRGIEIKAPSMGRFGTTISSLSDLNGDGLRDVAVGAPLEEHNAGAVYIYLGQRVTGMRNDFSQRITGADFHPGLRFFGQAINGDIDLGDDRLPDILVGSKGAAVVLRSKPVIDVKAKLSFYPNVISMNEITCDAENNRKNNILLMVTIRACFEMSEATKSTAGPGINISFMLNVDPQRQLHRGFFIINGRNSRNLTNTYKLIDNETCFNDSIWMNTCVKDTKSPVNIKLNFSQADSENANVILNVDSSGQAMVEVPFEKQCTTNEICIANLKVDFEFMSKEVLVTEDNSISVLIKLDNTADDSYNTSLIMHYPVGLSFTIIEATGKQKVTFECQGQEDVLDETVCGISRPVYRSKSSTRFNATFRIDKSFAWNDTMSLTFSANSENLNLNSTKIPEVTKSIPVRYSISMAISENNTNVRYMNFTPEKYGPRKMAIIYNIGNTGFKDFPVNISLLFPKTLEHNFEVKDYKVIVDPVLKNKTQCSAIHDQKSEDCPPRETCVVVKCNTFTLKNYSTVYLTLMGDVHFRNLQNFESNMPFLKKYTGEKGQVSFKSFLLVDYDGERYMLTSHKHKNNHNNNNRVKKTIEVDVEFIVPQNKVLIIVTGVLLGFMLLIIITVIMWKCGYFNRKIQNYEQQMSNTPLQSQAVSKSSLDEPEEPEEEKKPLNEDEDECKSMVDSEN